MVQYIITPWRNRAELLQVRDLLFPGRGREVNKEERRHAVASVSVWMQRGNCPHLVESTALLTAAALNDVAGNSTYCVRAAYAAAFCRYVWTCLDFPSVGASVDLVVWLLSCSFGVFPRGANIGLNDH